MNYIDIILVFDMKLFSLVKIANGANKFSPSAVV